MHVWLLPVWVLTICVACLVSSARAQPSDASYEALIPEALSEFNAGNYAEARALFEQAHALKPSARTMRGLAITSYELKRYVQSLRELEAALAEQRSPLTPEQSTRVRELMAKARRFVGKVRFATAPSSASVFVDERPVEGGELLLDMGIYRVLVRAPGYRTAELKLVVNGGEDLTERVALVPLDVSPERAAASAATGDDATKPASAHVSDADETAGTSVVSTWWFWTSIGAVAIGGTAVALAIGLSGRSNAEQPQYQGSADSLRGP